MKKLIKTGNMTILMKKVVFASRTTSQQTGGMTIVMPQFLTLIIPPVRHWGNNVALNKWPCAHTMMNASSHDDMVFKIEKTICEQDNPAPIKIDENWALFYKISPRGVT